MRRCVIAVFVVLLMIKLIFNGYGDAVADGNDDNDDDDDGGGGGAGAGDDDVDDDDDNNES